MSMVCLSIYHFVLRFVVLTESIVLARNMIEKVDHPACGPIKLVNHPVKYSRAEPKIRSPPPTLGEHTDEVLRELLDFNDAEIEDLKMKKTVA